MIVNIAKGSGITGAMKYVQGEGRDDLTGKLKPKGHNSRAELLGGQGFGFAIKSEADAELARKIMEFYGRPENQASKTKPCELDCEHISLSWAKGQHPDRAEKIKAAEGVLAALGMGNARAVYYAHHDAAYDHIHIVASRLDPATLRAYSDFEDRYKAQAWSLQWERENNQIVASRQRMHDMADAARAGDHAALRNALTANEATFTRKDADRAFAWAGYFGKERNAPREAFLADREIIPLREKAGESIKAYTTRAILADERAVQRDARALHERRGFGLRLDTVAAQGIAYGLSREQAEALDHVTADNSFAIIAGAGGVGKSTVLKAVRDAHKAQGYRVLGLSFQNKVVGAMRRDGFEASTIRTEIKRVEREADAWRGTVLIVDEAAQLSTQDLGELLRYANDRQAKVILAGDPKQLGSIDRGGMFTPLRNEFGAAQLNEVRRVADEEQKKAFGLMHGGSGERDFAAALRIFEERGDIHWSANRAQAVRDLGAKYNADVEADPAKKRLILAHTNQEVDKLNEFARVLHRERGELGEDHTLTTKHGELAFAAGDRVSITDNGPTKAAKEAGLVNGAFGRITAIGIAPEGKREVTVELDGERDKSGPKFCFVVGNNRELGEFGGFKHGYASTVYKSQGDTLDQVYDLHSPSGRADANYVSMTRHRESVSVFVAKDKTKDIAALAEQMSRGADKTAASSYAYEARDFEVKEAVRDAGERAKNGAEHAPKPAVQQGAAQEAERSAGAATEKQPPQPERQLEQQATAETRSPSKPVDPASMKVEAQPAPGKSLGGIEQVVGKAKEFDATIEKSETHSDARGAATEYKADNSQEQGSRQIDGAALPDPEAMAKGGKLDQVFQLGKQPGKTVSGLHEAFRESNSGLDYMEALKERGFRLAQVDGFDHMESVQRREDAEAVKGGRKPRVLEEGQLVAVNRYGSVYQINAYATGAKQSEIEAKTGGIDRGTLPNLKSAYFMARVDAIEKGAGRDADLGAWRQKVESARGMEAAKERGQARGKAEGLRQSTVFGRGREGVGRAITGIGNLAGNILGGFASEIENMGLSAEARAERKAEDKAIREAAPSARELRAHEQEVVKVREEGEKSSRNQAVDPQTRRYADAAKSFEQFIEQEKGQDGGREITRDRGRG